MTIRQAHLSERFKWWLKRAQKLRIYGSPVLAPVPSFAFLFVFLADLKRIIRDVTQLIYFGICWIPLWRSPKGKCVTHTMFMKFQTLSQSFDQILRYGPLVTDAMLPVHKNARNHVHR